MIVDVLDGDRYTLKSLTGNRTYKYAHDSLLAMPTQQDPAELDDNESIKRAVM